MSNEPNLLPSDEAFAKQVIEQLYDTRVIAYIVKTQGSLDGFVRVDAKRQIAALDPDRFPDFILKLLEKNGYNSYVIEKLDPIKHADILIEIASKNDDRREAEMAVKRLESNLNALIKIAASGSWAAGKAIEMLDETHQSLFIKVAMNESARIFPRVVAVDKLHFGDYEDELGLLLRRLQTREDASSSECNDGLFTAVIKKIQHPDMSLLIRIAREHKDRYVREAAAKNIPLNEESIPQLIKLLNKSGHYEVCYQIAQKLDASNEDGPFHKIILQRRHELDSYPWGFQQF